MASGETDDHPLHTIWGRCKMKIRITPGAVLLLAVLAFDKSTVFAASVLAAALHECGHLLAARLLHIPLRLLELDLMGARLYPASAIPSYRAEAILAAAGPLCSILLAVPFLSTRIPFFVALRTATLSFALFNLLPIEGFDGGRILFSLLASRFGENGARRVLLVSSYLSLLFVFALASCLLLRYGEDATLAVLSASLFARLFLSFGTPVRKPKGGDRKKRGFERI